MLPEDATNKNVSWTSSAPTIASVDASGKVSALAEGTAAITVTTEDGQKTAVCQVTVIGAAIAVTDVTLDKPALELTVGEEETLVPTVLPEDATNKNVGWTSSAPAIASVDANGKVSALAIGTADITVTTVNGGKTAICKVTVVEKTIPVTDISLNKSSLSLNVGENETLTATVRPEEASDKTVTWESSAPEIASVDQTGKVTALASGSATIIAFSGGEEKRSASCQVTVTMPSNDIENNEEDKTEAEEQGVDITGGEIWIAGLSPSYEYTGSAITPEIRVYQGTTQLREKKEYSVSYRDNTKIGKASVTVKGVGTYSGSDTKDFMIDQVDFTNNKDIYTDTVKSGKTTKVVVYWKGKKLTEKKDYTVGNGVVTGVGNFKGTAVVETAGKTLVAMSKTKITLDKSKTYTGAPIIPTVTIAYANAEGGVLKQDTDYRVECLANTNVGTATVMIYGNEENGYTGAVKKTFKITAAPLSDNDVSLAGGSAAYAKGGVKPVPEVTFTSGDKTWVLREGVDYTVSYKNNTAAGKTGTVIVKGTGNFSGTVSKVFSVAKRSISALSGSCVNKQYSAKKKGSFYQSAPEIYDLDGKKLSSGKDYTITGYYNVTQKKALGAKDTPAAGDVLRVTAEGKGSYEGELSVEYVVESQIPKNLKGAKISKIDIQGYTGEAVTPDFTVTLNGTTLIKDSAYEVHYYNNVKKGTATIMIFGKGSCCGYKSFTFKIGTRKF